jgi:hypothetical protein
MKGFVDELPRCARVRTHEVTKVGVAIFIKYVISWSPALFLKMVDAQVVTNHGEHYPDFPVFSQVEMAEGELVLWQKLHNEM